MRRLAGVAILSAAPVFAAGLPKVDISPLPPAIRAEIEAARARAETSPDDAAAAGDLGMLYLAYDLPVAAAACFETSSAREPAGFRWAYFLGLARHAAGDPAAAIAALEKAVTLRPDDAPALTRLGGLLLESNSARAEQLFIRALKVDPDNARAHAGLGHAARSAGRAGEALGSFQAALRAAPDYAEAHYAAAMILAAQGKRAEAADHLKQHAAGGEPPLSDDPLALELARKGRNASALRREATHLSRRGDMDGAIALLRAAVAIDSEGTSRQALGLLLAQQRRFAEAASELARVVEADPGNVDARSTLGLALAELGRDAEAEAEYREGLRRHPDHAPSCVYLAQLLGRTGRVDEAVALARRGAAAQPANGLYQLTLADLQARAGRATEALETMRKAVAILPSHAGARQALAAMLSAAGDRNGAIEQWKAACDLTGWTARRPIEALADAYEAAGRAADAAAARERAARLPPP